MENLLNSQNSHDRLTEAFPGGEGLYNLLYRRFKPFPGSDRFNINSPKGLRRSLWALPIFAVLNDSIKRLVFANTTLNRPFSIIVENLL